MPFDEPVTIQADIPISLNQLKDTHDDSVEDVIGTMQLFRNIRYVDWNSDKYKWCNSDIYRYLCYAIDLRDGGMNPCSPQDNQDDEQQDETSHLTNREKFIEAFKATDSNWRTLNEEAARNSLLLLQNLEEILEELHGDEMPSASSLRNTLTELILIHERYKGVKGMSVKDDQMPDSNAETQENNAINDDPSPTNTKITKEFPFLKKNF